MNATSCRAVSIGLFLRLLHLLLPPLWSSAAMKPSAWHIFFSILSCSVIVRLLSCLLFFLNYFTIFICLFLGRSFNDEPGRQGSSTSNRFDRDTCCSPYIDRRFLASHIPSRSNPVYYGEIFRMLALRRKEEQGCAIERSSWQSCRFWS